MTFNLKPEYKTIEFELQNGLKAAVQNEGTGLSIFVEGFEDPVAFLDYYYLIHDVRQNIKIVSDVQERPQAATLVVYDTANLSGDPVSFARFEPEQTVVFFETYVQVVSRDKRLGDLYGYRRGDK